MKITRQIPATARCVALAALTVAVVGCTSSSPTPTPSFTPGSTTVASASLPAAQTPDLATPGSTATPAATATQTASGSAAATTGVPAVPDFSHVYVIILENKEYNRIVGSDQAPYMNSLASKYGLATNFFAETHPSEPNYIALTSGGLQGTNSDGAYNLNVPNLFDQIEASGRTWRTYAQSYPGGCYKGSIASPVADGPGAVGDYVRKHDPAMSYTSISGNAARCASITRLAPFDPAAADFELIIPNEINDMHSSSVAAGDAFLKLFVPSIVNSPAFDNSVLFITFDEGDSDLSGGGRIATIVASPGMKPGTRLTRVLNHYSMLRTIELAWGLPLLGQAATAATMDLGY